MPAPSLAEARARLAAEWQAAAPRTADEIAAFYRTAEGLADDLDAWHQTPERAEWTRMIVHVARESNADIVVDIGCGAGHDLVALHDGLAAGLRPAALWGVEPNDRLRHQLASAAGWLAGTLAPSVDDVPIAAADLLVCIDVLEHVVAPETFLGDLAQRAPVGCLLIEAVATHDLGTPLHLPANRGWHPGRALERHGWAQVDRSGRLRVWRREAPAGGARASILLCAYRSVGAEVLSSLLGVCAGQAGWRLRVKTGDALISRSRSILVTSWWRETNDDVFLMVDDDIVFTPADAARLVTLCRDGHDLICGAYPVHDGGHLACRFLPGVETVTFGNGRPPLEIQYAGTGFLAVHRRVVDALIADLPLCHAGQPWSFYPLFQPLLLQVGDDWEWLSEDWGMVERARRAGFRCWLDPQTRLTHLGQAGVSVRNMAALHRALAGA